MAEENLKVVREMYARRERGDMDVHDFVHPDIEFIRIGSQLADFAGEWRGLDGMRRATVEYLNAWEDQDGKIVRWEYYWERADAREAAGIAE